MMTDTCSWCGTNRIEAAKRFEGPHATWCVHFRESQRGGDPNSRPFASLGLAGLQTKAVLDRALNQIGNALKDFGLFIEIDPEGNYSIGRLPAEFPIKDERVSDWLRRCIHQARAWDRPATRIRINYDQAKRLAAELSELEYNRATSEAEIYSMLVAGECRFLDVPVEVHPE